MKIGIDGASPSNTETEVVDGNKTIKDRVDGGVGHDAAQVIKGNVALSMYACTILHVLE